MNRDKLIRKLEKWSVKLKDKGYEDSAAVLRRAVQEICELQRQLDLMRKDNGNRRDSR